MPPPTKADLAEADRAFDFFLCAQTLKTILGYHRTICDALGLRPGPINTFYPPLKKCLTGWKAASLWKKFDARASRRCYAGGRAGASPVLIVGAGPCGLRAAIEAQFLGLRVVVVEKRDRFSRNNVLHLWPFVIEDLRALGAKKFFGKFCAGAIDHISIRQLQCILLKVALLLGVEVFCEVGFEDLVEPEANYRRGWRGKYTPIDHPLHEYEFDVIIGADGKRNTLEGFKRKEFRGKLAIAITVNFINKKTEAEARVEEISGVAFIFNQKFFKDLHEQTRIDLENIVYYKDDTHYFVMTAKKASLLEKGVIKEDMNDTEKLLAPENVDSEALQNYAREAADFSTNYQMPDLEFAVNHYGQPDIAMFDFTSMYAAEYASKVMNRNNVRLLMLLVGDSLLEPFWPTGSGCARGFLSAYDAVWAIRDYVLGSNLLTVLAERESSYRLLAQTTPDNLNKDWKSFGLSPHTRYPNFNRHTVKVSQVFGQVDSDNPQLLENLKEIISKRLQEEENVNVSNKRKREKINNEILLSWFVEQLEKHESIVLTDLSSVFKSGNALCAIINKYRPDLIDYEAVKDLDAANMNQLAFEALENAFGIVPVMTGEESVDVDDYLTMASYLTQIYDVFRGEIPHIKHPKLELPQSKENSLKNFKVVPPTPAAVAPSSRPSSRHKRHVDAVPSRPYSVDKKTRKRRPLERLGSSVGDRQKVLEEIAANRSDRQNKRRQQRKYQTEQFLKSMQMLQTNAKDDDSQPFEDYSIFLYRQTAPKFEDRVKDWEKQFVYVPDHDSKSNVQKERRGSTAADEDIAAKIKNLENKWANPTPVEKKPKDLLRAIGKIDNSDWNIKEIEKKILENKLGKPSTQNKDKEKVPKWSKEQFLARQNKMESKHLDRQDSNEAKYADIDKNIKHLDLKLKEGTARDLGQNKVATITEKLTSKTPGDTKPIERTGQKPAILTNQNPSELCHFCNKRVYLMERLSAEGRFFHHGCFKCQYCHTQLRLGSYSFDRDGQFGYKFFCVHHYGMQGDVPRESAVRKYAHRKSPEKSAASRVTGVDLLDRVLTPERAEFANLSNVSSDHDEMLSQMDEDEWSYKNGLLENDYRYYNPDEYPFSNESESDSDIDYSDDAPFDDALEEPVTKEGTMKWAERWKNMYSKKNRSESDTSSSSDDHSNDDLSSDDYESDTATEEEEVRQRELRKKEVDVEPPLVHTDTGTETEIFSDETTTESSSEIPNSATEISTDSEFTQDEPTPTRDGAPSLVVLDDSKVTKTRGSGRRPQKFQIGSGYLPTKVKTRIRRNDSVKKESSVKKVPQSNYALNRTQSTGGIATKISLELKKKYLLGDSNESDKRVSSVILEHRLKAMAWPDKSDVFKSKSSIILPDITITNTENKSDDTKTVEIKSDTNISPLNFNIPRLEVTEDNFQPDSLTIEDNPTPIKSDINSDNITNDFKTDIIHDTITNVEIKPNESESRASTHSSVNSEPLKSITSDKKVLNQPKELPKLENKVPCEIHFKKIEKNSPENESSPEITTAMTETELSDWARDGAVSEDDIGLELSEEKKKTIEIKSEGIIKDVREFKSDILNDNLDSIEYMDTGTETSSEDVLNSQDGYVLFKNDDEIVDDSLDVNINEKIKSDIKSDNVKSDNIRSDNIKSDIKSDNKGFCVIVESDKINESEVFDIKPSDYDKIKEKRLLNTENDMDSLVVLEKDTTTEENTFSDSTVKNITEIASDIKIKSDDNIISQINYVDLINKPKDDNIEITPTKNDINNIISSPTNESLYTKDNIRKERARNQQLIHEMVLNKMKSENRSLERKKRVRNSYELAKSATTDIGTKITQNRPISTFVTPDLIPNLVPLQNSKSAANIPESTVKNVPTRPLSIFSEIKNVDKTPVAPPRLKKIESLENEQKISENITKQNNRNSQRKKTMSIADMMNVEYKNEKENNEPKKICKSDPNLLEMDPKKSRERRKSITKFITNIFTRKSSPGIFSKFSPKSKEISKSCGHLESIRPESDIIKHPRRQSFSELSLQKGENTPPPIPPLPLEYAVESVYATDDSSDGDRCHNDAMDHSNFSSGCRRRSKSSRLNARKVHEKRHRLAQEIQRKLEETEVKTKELEQRGVLIEKSLRGENSHDNSRDESELLQEWFDLMRDRTELRRYERELSVRAKELELEDQHARLQQELRERLLCIKPKTKHDVDAEETIIKEMMEIVSRRDTLLSVLEEDKLRYLDEDRDFEGHMLEKGLQLLTPLTKTPEK